MSDQIIQLPPDSTGKKVDTSELTVGSNTVQRERMNIADPNNAASIVGVTPGSGAGTGGMLQVLSAGELVQQTTQAAINVNASGASALVAASGSTTVRVWKLFLVVAGPTVLTFEDSTPTALSGPIPLLAGGSITLDFDTEPWFLTAAGKGFSINSSNAVQISGSINYTQS